MRTKTFVPFHRQGSLQHSSPPPLYHPKQQTNGYLPSRSRTERARCKRQRLEDLNASIRTLTPTWYRPPVRFPVCYEKRCRFKPSVWFRYLREHPFLQNIPFMCDARLNNGVWRHQTASEKKNQHGHGVGCWNYPDWDECGCCWLVVPVMYNIGKTKFDHAWKFQETRAKDIAFRAAPFSVLRLRWSLSVVCSQYGKVVEG